MTSAPAAAPVSKPVVAGIDAGGTMTDTILVDIDGNYAVGKAATTPADESLGFLESAADASAAWGIPVDEMFAGLEVLLYSGTGMLNTLLSRGGRKLGLLTTRGMEDAVLMGRGLQAWADYSYADRLHAVTHAHPSPLLPRGRVFGVTERVDQFGEVVIPVYEREAEEGARKLLAQNVEAICVCTLFSHVNPAHEKTVGAIAKKVAAEGGRDVPVYLSCEVRPVIREQSRLNSVLIEAYACDRGRAQLRGVERAARSRGYRRRARAMLSYGGLAGTDHPRLHETMISGPIGGILGAMHVGKTVGADSLIVSDMGGTSFDMGVVTRGQIRMDNEPLLGRFKLNVPTIAMDCVGAGAGMAVKADPLTRKAALGPESMGADPGPACFGRGGDRATVCDCDLILGRLNADYFLGGKVKLDADRAARAIEEQVAKPLGADLHAAAEGMADMLDNEANSALRRILSSQGAHPSEFTLLSYGGSGPLHLAGYSRGIPFKDIVTFPFAAAFSAFGCAAADHARRHVRSVQIDIPKGADDSRLRSAAAQINAVWDELTRAALREMADDGHPESAVRISPFLMMRYTGQLEDVETPSPVARAEGAADVRKILAAFDDHYARVNRNVSRHDEGGRSVTELGIAAEADKVKPRLVRRLTRGKKPGSAAAKGSRKVFFNGEWRDADLWEMDELAPGNEVAGPAVVEHPATTLLIRPGDRVSVDEWTVFHYRHGE